MALLNLPEADRAVELLRSKPDAQQRLGTRRQCGHARRAIGSEKLGWISLWRRAICARFVHVGGNVEGHALSWPRAWLWRTRRSASLHSVGAAGGGEQSASLQSVAVAGCGEMSHAWRNKGHAIGCRQRNRCLAEGRARGHAVLRYEEAECPTERASGKRLLRSRPTVILCQACLSFPSGHCCSDCKKTNGPRNNTTTGKRRAGRRLPGQLSRGEAPSRRMAAHGRGLP